MSTNVSKSESEFWEYLDKKLSSMTAAQLDKFQDKIDALLKEKERAALAAKAMTEEQLLKLYNGSGYYPNVGDKFWRIRGNCKSEGLYGWQVGQFEHSCLIDIMDLIVLFIIEPGSSTGSRVEHFSELWLEGPIIVGGKKKESEKPARRALDGDGN